MCTICVHKTRRDSSTGRTVKSFNAKGVTHPERFCVIAAFNKRRKETSHECLMRRSAGEWVCCVFTTATKLQDCLFQSQEALLYSPTSVVEKRNRFQHIFTLKSFGSDQMPNFLSQCAGLQFNVVVVYFEKLKKQNLFTFSWIQMAKESRCSTLR